MLLVGNGIVLTMGKQNRVSEQAAVLIEGAKIKEIGPTSVLRTRYPTAQFIDARGKLIMPGLINTHMHLYSTFARGMAALGQPPRTFQEILERLWWRLDKALSLEDVYYSALLPLIECIKTGTTTIIDHHASPRAITGSLAEIARAAEATGVKTCLCYEVSDRDGEEAALAGIEENGKWLAAVGAEPKEKMQLAALFGLHASFTLSDQTLARCKTAADRYGAGFHIHVAEGIEDVQHSLSGTGKRVVERLQTQGILGPKTIAAHCVHISEQEIEILRQSGTLVVHNPESNMGNAVGTAPVLSMLEQGLCVGLGTDGYTADMFESAKVANLLLKHSTANPSAAWAEVPQMLYVNNPRIAAQLFGGVFGELSPGAWADVLVVDYQPPTPFNESNWSGHLLFGVAGRSVETTIINGQVRMLNRQLLDLDEAALSTKARELAAKLWQRV